MTKLRKSARGQDCHLRIPGVCNHNPETTVLAHLRGAMQGGMGFKPPDVCGVFACSDCHDALDYRTNRVPRELLHEYALEGHLRTLVYWKEHGYL